MRFGRHHYTVEWGHFTVVTLVAAVCAVYLIDARGASLSVNNLLFVQPAAIMALILYALIVPQCFHRGAAEPASLGQAERVSRRREWGRAAALAAALGFFVFSFETIGADTSTLLFTAAALFLCGERRPLWLVLYPVGLTLAVIEGYQRLVPYPMFTLLL